MKNIVFFLMSLMVVFLAVSSELLAANQFLEQATISGQVQSDISDLQYPLKKIAFFRVEDKPSPDQGIFHRVPDALIAINSEGKFAITISPGQYHLGYLNSSQPPPLAISNRNTVFLLAVDDNGALLTITANPGQATHLAKITFKARSMQKSLPSYFSVSGRVVTEKDTPVLGYTVIAKNNFNDIRPSFISAPTSGDGRFQIVLPPGDYVLIARPPNITFGRPQIGELFGVYGQTVPLGAGGAFSSNQGYPSPVSGSNGDVIEEITIILFPIPDPEKRQTEQRGL